MRLTSAIKYNLYHFVKRRPANIKGEFLPLYISRVFQENNLDYYISEPGEAAQRYKQFLPFTLLAASSIFKPKVLVTKIDFNAESEVYKIQSLRSDGFIVQQFSVDNIIPWTYADLRSANNLPEPTLPTFIDDTMVYFNRFNNQTLIFESDGNWNEQTIKHPKLSLDARLSEKEWFDRRYVI